MIVRRWLQTMNKRRETKKRHNHGILPMGRGMCKWTMTAEIGMGMGGDRHIERERGEDIDNS